MATRSPWTSTSRCPVVDDAPTLIADGVDLGPATESADGLSLSLVTTDDSVASADEVELGWGSGDDAKVEPPTRR